MVYYTYEKTSQGFDILKHHSIDDDNPVVVFDVATGTNAQLAVNELNELTRDVAHLRNKAETWKETERQTGDIGEEVATTLATENETLHARVAELEAALNEIALLAPRLKPTYETHEVLPIAVNMWNAGVIAVKALTGIYVGSENVTAPADDTEPILFDHDYEQYKVCLVYWDSGANRWQFNGVYDWIVDAREARAEHDREYFYDYPSTLIVRVSNGETLEAHNAQYGYKYGFEHTTESEHDA